MRRTAFLFVLAALLLSLADCGGESESASTSPPAPTLTLGGDLSGEGGSGIFKGKEIPLPRPELYVQRLAGSGQNIFACAWDGDASYIFRLKLDELSFDAVTGALPGGVSALCTTKGGGVAAVCYEPGEESGSLTYTLLVYAPDGSLLRETPLDALLPPDSLAVTDAISCDKGLLLATVNSLVLLDDADKASVVLGGLSVSPTLVKSGSGSVLLCAGTEGGYSILEYAPDLSASAEYALDEKYVRAFGGCGDTPVYLSDGVNLYAVNHTTGKRQNAISLVSNGVNDRSIICVSKGVFFGESDGVPMLWSRQTDTAKIRTLTLASYNADMFLTGAIKSFNSQSEYVRIDLVDYAAYDTTGGSGLDRLNADIIAGKYPDIFDLTCLPADTYRQKGLLADVSAFADGMLPGVVKALTENGAMYSIMPSYKLMDFVASKSLFPDGTWSVQDLLTLAAESDIPVFSTLMSQSYFLERLLSSTGDRYYSLVDGRCSFDTPEFVSLLSYAATLPETEEFGEGPFSQVYHGELQVMEDFCDSYIVGGKTGYDALFGGDGVVFLGFPGIDGAAMVPCMRLGMFSRSENEEGVEEFFTFLLSDAYQRYLSGWKQLPARQETLDDLLEREYKRLQTEPAGVGFGDNGNLVDIYGVPPTRETIEEVRQTLLNASTLYHCDENIYVIVMEEARAFFAGARTAQEAAALIQSRVSLYLAEQS